MPNDLSPGVYLEEVPTGHRAIHAAATSIAGMVGMTERGPVNQPILVSSQGEFSHAFGGLLNPLQYAAGRDALPYAVEGFFVNGGMQLYVVRVVGEHAVEATLHINAQDALLETLPMLRVHARYPGVWGDSLRVTLHSNTLIESKVRAAASANDTTVALDSAIGLLSGMHVSIDHRLSRLVTGVDTAAGTVTFSQVHAEKLTADMWVRCQEFTLTVDRIENGKAVESETFERLSMIEEHPRYVLKVIGSWDVTAGAPSVSGASSLIRVENLTNANTRNLPLISPVSGFLGGGNDDVGGVSNESYCGVASDNPMQRTGIFALENEPTISIVAVPGQTSVMLQKALIAHCQRMRYRFAVLDTPIAADLAAARAHRQNFDSTHCALYYPALVRADSFGALNGRRVISPSGHVLGVYARTDIARGVHKAPANEAVQGILAFATQPDNKAQALLNPIGLNCFRDFRSENRGLRVYGARVATSDPEYKYINVRRLLLMIEQSLEIGLQWTLSEANNRVLWNTVKQSVIVFLSDIWRSGALAGQKPEEAFFVNVGYNQTMTQEDMDKGRLRVEIGVAPLKPAEFVIVRSTHKTREAQA